MTKELLRTFAGQLSIGIILFVIVMGAYLTRMFVKLSSEEQQQEQSK